MNFVPVNYYVNYIDAHIAKGQLEDEGIECWLKDENMVTINPFLTNAVGGIKLMVAEQDLERTKELLQLIDHERRNHFLCPKCSSNNVELVSTPRKASNWIGAVFGFMFGDYAVAVDKVYHCFECGNEFDLPTEE